MTLIKISSSQWVASASSQVYRQYGLAYENADAFAFSDSIGALLASTTGDVSQLIGQVSHLPRSQLHRCHPLNFPSSLASGRWQSATAKRTITAGTGKPILGKTKQIR